MTRRIVILGATGSIGKSTLDLVESSPDRFEVVAVTAATNSEALAEIARRTGARLAVVADERKLTDLGDMAQLALGLQSEQIFFLGRQQLGAIDFEQGLPLADPLTGEIGVESGELLLGRRSEVLGRLLNQPQTYRSAFLPARS